MNETIYSREHKYTAGQLKKARREAGFNQTQVAKMIGRTQSYVSKMEVGQVRIDVVQLKKIARIYKKRLDYFVK